MNAGLDAQLGDLVWSISTGLRAGYNLRQVFEVLAAEAPEPAASACRRFIQELDKSQDIQTALSCWKQAIPSTSLARLSEVLDQHQQAGGDLANMLDPLGEALIGECGSDPAFYEAMRREADQLGARLPDRVINR